MTENEEGTDFQSYKKLCQFWGVLKGIDNDDVYNRFLDQLKVNKQLEIIIKKDGDINYQFPNDDVAVLCNPELAGCTALHLAVGRKNEIVKVLLSRPGIDFTIKNHEGSTALHEALRRYYYYYNGRWQIKGTLNNKNVNAILSAHVKLDISENPCNKRGLSHFHIACMANNVRAVEFFISKGVSVHEAVVGDFSMFLGYTPLHFAVYSCSWKTVKILLKYGADVNQKDAKGMSPVHLLLEEQMADDNIKIMKTLLGHIIDFKNRLKFNGKHLFLFDMACTLESTNLLKQLMLELEDVDRCVKMDSTFSAYFDTKILTYLLQHEANVEVKDGLTPFDICLERYKVEDLHSIISSNPLWKDLLFSDNKTRLSDIVSAMKDSNTLDDFLKDVESCQTLSLPNDSALWPGYTLLHLAVNLSSSERESDDCSKDCFKERDCEYITRIKVCLKHGVDLTVQEARGWTALHLAYRLQKTNAVKLLLQEHTQTVNPIDEDNLSHLHIACAFNYPRLVEKLLLNDNAAVNLKSTFERRNCIESDFFMTAGSTPLHAAVASDSSELVRILLEHGANVNAKDSNGMTPVHRALACEHSARNVGRILLSSPNLEEYTFQGLNHLHLAAEFCSEEDVIEKFISLGADVNSAIDFHIEAEDNLNSFCVTVAGGNRLADPFAFKSKFNKFTPIDIAIHRGHREIVKVMLNRGVDIFARRADGWTLVHKALHGCNCNDLIVAMIKCNATLQQRMQEETGITLLHFACKDFNIDEVEYYLENGANVNTQVKLDSPLWPGYTAMHILARQAFQRVSPEKISSILKLLLENGADFTLMNLERNAPIDETFTYDIYTKWPLELTLRSMKHFSVCPIDAQGLSRFHVACLQIDLAVMKQFLKCYVDVNQPVAFHSDNFPGCTPLHLVLHPHSSVGNDVRLEAIDLLIKQRANGHVTDLYGNTLFHAVTKCASPRTSLLEKIFSIGVSIDAKNVFGEEPFGMLLSSRKFEYSEVNFFLKHNCHANLYDPIREEGYLKYLFGNNHPIKKMVKHSSITTIDDFGRNAIHNVVSWEWCYAKSYYQIIPMLMEKGCKIDQQDKLGRTPLHYAVKFSNGNAVIDLLGAGADINVIDATGNTPFSHVFSLSKDSEWHQYEFDCSRIFLPMAMHLHKLQITGLFVSDLNVNTLKELLKKCSLDPVKIERANNELTKMKDLKIESTQLSPYDFFAETGAIAEYPYMSLLEQQAIEKFFTSIKKRDFGELGYLLKIRYEKALKRLSLLIPAKIGLNRLSKCALPENCSRNIMRFLSNTEIENVIASVNLTIRNIYRKNLEKMLITNKKLKCI